MNSPSLPVDVLIPVYRGTDETRRCLESVLRSRESVAFEVTVINDASPDPALVEDLRALEVAGKIKLLHNERNLGFVATVNRGMSLHADRDIILLNSDTEVPPGWVDRLVRCADRDPRIATVTPFSNNATICSYPRFCEVNPVPPDVDAMDRFFREANAQAAPIDLPTAVGFCMFIRRKCLNEIGLFDVENFGRGYGEENDFSLRAAKKGWRNVLCPDLYVAHVGGVSFSATSHEHRAAGEAALLRKHPNYNRLVHRHMHEDPERPLRATVDLRRIQKSGKPSLLFLTHHLGGGTEKHVRDLARLIFDRANVFALRRVSESFDTVLEWLNPNEGFRLYFKLPGDIDTLTEVLRGLVVTRVHIHHFIGLEPSLFELPTRLGVPYDLTAHDFYTICPRINLVGVDHKYCGEPNEAGCDACLRQRPRTEAHDIRSWRTRFRPIVETAERVIAPSEFVATRFRRHFPGARLVVAAHPEPQSPQHSPHSSYALDPAPSYGTRRKVAIFGVLDAKKGRDVLLACAAEAKQRSLPLEFHLFGKLLPPAHVVDIIDHGTYSDDSELAERLLDLAPNVAWFPAQGPETYSYTLSVALRLSIPIVASDLGAFPERLTGYPNTRTVPWTLTPSLWLHRLLESDGDNSRAPLEPPSPQNPPLSFYLSVYLAPLGAATSPKPMPKLALGHFIYPSHQQDPNYLNVLRHMAMDLRYLPLIAPIANRIPRKIRKQILRLLAR